MKPNNVYGLMALWLLSCAPPLLQTAPQAGQVQALFADQQKAISNYSHFDRLKVWEQHLCDISTRQRQFSMTCLNLTTQQVIHTAFNDAPFPLHIPRYPLSQVGKLVPLEYVPPFIQDEKGNLIPISQPTSPYQETEDYPMVLGAGRAGVYLGLANHLIQSNTLTDRVPDLKWTQFLPQPEAKTAEQIQVLSALAETPDGQLYLADWKRYQIFRLKDGQLTLFAGSGQAGFKDGNAQTAQFNQIQALEADGQGNLYLLEKGSHRLRKITPDGSVSTLAGGAEAGYREGPGSEAHLNQPSALAVSPEGVVFVADTGNHRIRRLEPDGQVSTFVGNGQAGVERENANSANALNGPRLEVAVTPTSLALGQDGTLYFVSGQRVFRTPTR
ncbi:MAG: hypothetical protein IV090_25730 [Candidatus Sericytochromatia bacterium]|nr:hypothetical protein [Candidatus Sericytochromatia bacterium]